ncbi:hypothetical protein [Tuwongella immobilis]|uniref:Cytochrome c peroxidase: Uncharacterized protein n=1 Tax=Tuwongella immobilis TaxID=692036 RepID=A0A6C2YST1_9BACT|nr:hypothetical protein [Tuwongella immobilis]VIP04119.1 cytochrome c peroxidase : Uncharacterized protein OS=Pirellula staleyi (strain ATCC 27377 / DSM 6068 / ICPB 4128) GN=Psta_0767 PE=4 SV=1 [Tuwongella immobilis]VTS05604.1 cytochrome c peroxidase : Uncharacterized protein OS=Pirellula staleyi (strain ATCC 27377 / DSM 6068 / ICPB 4128) GN=Psta_0767 PE=4 SV=1 [Tuwongella immobilis]
MRFSTWLLAPIGICLISVISWLGLRSATVPHWESVVIAEEAKPVADDPTTRDRSPVDLLLSPDEQWMITVNQASATVSLIRLRDGQVVDEVACGERPAAICWTPDSRQILVTGTYAGDLRRFTVQGEQLVPSGQLTLRFEPRGVAVTPDGKKAYVALTTGGVVAVVRLSDFTLEQKIPAGKWPRYLALSQDGTRLAVGANGSGGVCVIDPIAGKQLFIEDFLGINMGQMQISSDGKYVYLPWMVYRQNPITPLNIQIGWVLASRIARVRLDSKHRREAIALDTRGEAVADPHGLALTPGEEWVVCAASGSQELLVFQHAGLPFSDYGGPGDHIDPQLLADKKRFYRIPLGGRPMFVRVSKDGRTVYVANALLDAVQVVDIRDRKIVRTIPLSAPHEPSLARKGEAIFYDGKRSLDQWYSCHSCHYEGHTNAVAMDTTNDGSFRTFKTVLTLRNVTKTGPWTWHGWQKDLDLAMKKSLTESMLGPKPKPGDEVALVAYLETLKPPANPNRNPDGSLTEAAKRGERVFKSEKADCVRCHKEPYYTSPKLTDVGTGARNDAYPTYNPPSLVHTFDRVRWLHDGRAKSLRQVLTGDHNPNLVTGKGELTPQELDDLLTFLESL